MISRYYDELEIVKVNLAMEADNYDNMKEQMQEEKEVLKSEKVKWMKENEVLTAKNVELMAAKDQIAIVTVSGNTLVAVNVPLPHL
ncbi:UNVERIFIED_CONTAM: hypothetical protein HDU68_011080 [Siphonaria sp. JEL0065]|nr:hypothetical protein HDU68_011080 [Siphonaria sp. JEL0065]